MKLQLALMLQKVGKSSNFIQAVALKKKSCSFAAIVSKILLAQWAKPYAQGRHCWLFLATLLSMRSGAYFSRKIRLPPGQKERLF